MYSISGSKSLAAAALLFLSARVAHADDCVIPAFNEQQHTYLSSTLEQDAQLRAQLDGLSEELISAGKATGHAITPYFVACQKNYQDGVPGVVFSHDVFANWMSSASFPWKDRVVVIAWVRNGYDKNHGSIGATAGQSLQDLGFDGDYFASRNGPILRDVRQFMPDNPKGEFVNIIRAIDDNIDSQIGHQQFAQKSQHALVWLLGLGLVVWLFMRWSKVQAEKETARSTIRKNDALVTAKLEQIKADSEALGKLDLHCATQLDAAKGLSVRQEEIRRQMRSYPVEAVQASERLVREAGVLQNAVKQSLHLLGEVQPSLENGIASAREAIANQRKQIVVFAFPGASPATDSQELFRLQSEPGNPDQAIAFVVETLPIARKLLVDGYVDDAQRQYNLAGVFVQNATALIKETLDAKAIVETLVPVIRNARADLLKSCEEGSQALEQLKSEFASVNFEDVADRIELGRKRAETVESLIDEAARLYLQQNFLTAKSRLENLAQTLKWAKEQVERVALRLVELRKKRSVVLQHLAVAGEKMATVGSKLKQNSHATSKTRQDYALLEEQHRRLSQASEDSSAINWLAMFLIWETITRGTETVSRQIDSDVSSYQSQQRAMESARSSYSSTSIDTSSSMSMGSGSGGGFGGSSGGGNY
jgi:hypothetical protein